MKIENSYLNQRRALGVLGISLPFLVLGFGQLGQNSPQWYYSISATFYTNAGPLFIAIMGSVGVFLISYIGYSRLDNIINKLSGLFALLIAFFPCGATELDYVGILHMPLKASAIIHNASAAIFFAMLAFNILFLFTKGSIGPTPQKIRRNRLYRTCGSGILVFMAAQVAVSVLALTGPYTLLNEMMMLFCFGLAWLVKGETFWKDKSEQNQ